MISGLDLVREQIRVAAGEKLGYTQDDIIFTGCSIEGRVNAEDPAANFRPAPGTVTAYREPAGLGVRVDSAAFPGFVISPDYDSMIAKLIVWAPTRAQAIARLARAIDEYEIEGVPTTLRLLRALCDYDKVKDASYGTQTLEPFAASHFATNGSVEPGQHDGSAPNASEEIRIEVNDKLYRVRVLDLPTGIAGAKKSSAPARRGGAKKRAASHGDDVVSPMHGVVVELKVKAGDSVEEQQVVAIVEAMKMVNEIRAHKSGTVDVVHAQAGATVDTNGPLVTLK
jgi:acetyl-CoA/propionyl-CoA carboxylase, biotin carboxylase, biotin carboxyl carrier protein